MASLSEFEIARYKKIAAEFLQRYELKGEFEAGKYAADQLRIEELPLARRFVVDAFIEAGYKFSEVENAFTD